MKRRGLLVIVVLATVTACSPATDSSSSTIVDSTTTSTTAPATTSTAPGATTTETIASDGRVAFGTLTPVALLSGGAYAGPETPTSLDDAYVPAWVDSWLAENDATRTLEQLGFVVIPATTQHFHHLYDGATYDGWPVYVTTDVAYHLWHLTFDKILRETEQQQLLPELETMAVALVDGARAQEAELAGSPLEEAASRVTQFYEAAAAVLEVDVGGIGPLAQQEVQLILDASEIALSPTTGGDAGSGFITTMVDYSLFRPRGHYTRNADLERYFRAMSQLGNNAFLVNDDSFALGVLASRVVDSDPAVTALWEHIYEPTAWLVGAADDYTPREVGRVVESVVGGWDEPLALTDDEVVATVRAGLLGMRTVAINPEAASVRVMGSRFVIDSYILDQLVIPNVQDRDEASPLDVAAAFGSDWALSVQQASGAAQAPGYDEAMTAMRQLVSQRDIEDWSGTVYDAWLWAVQPMWSERASDFPDYMQSDAWTAKSHQTGFGSYTELKHDTILYSKQAVAEGGGEEPEVAPRNWVEPDPVAYERLQALTALMAGGLSSRDLLPDDHATLLADLEGFYAWLGSIARDELAGIPIGEADNTELGHVGSTLEAFLIRTSDSDLDWETGPDSSAALVADVMRNATGVLELGTGYIDHIFVIVPDDRGGFQVATGGVYSYYEFWNTGQRLTDEEWRVELAAGTQPDRPPWQSLFLEGDLGPAADAGGLESGLFCRDVAAAGYDFVGAISYWMREGAPDRMDADLDGVPCETAYPADAEEFLALSNQMPDGLRCADLDVTDDDGGFLTAVAYWMAQGAPDRMDADGNGIPCETVFSAAVVQRFLALSD